MKRMFAVSTKDRRPKVRKAVELLFERLYRTSVIVMEEKKEG